MPMLLDIFKLGPWFDQVVTALDTPNPKPAPDALHMILEGFQLDVSEAIYIGDSDVDLEHTRAIGMEMIAFKSPLLEAAYHVNSFMEITRLPPFSPLEDQ